VIGDPFGIPKRSSALCMCMALRIAAIIPVVPLSEVEVVFRLGPAS
jgi:hypothetical protein